MMSTPVQDKISNQRNRYTDVLRALHVGVPLVTRMCRVRCTNVFRYLFLDITGDVYVKIFRTYGKLCKGIKRNVRYRGSSLVSDISFFISSLAISTYLTYFLELFFVYKFDFSSVYYYQFFRGKI